MNFLVLQGVLLADRAHWKRMGEAFTGEGAKLGAGEIMGLCALAVGIVALVSILSGLAKRTDSNKSYHVPKRLFRQLCDVHRLSWKDRGALHKLAEHLQLSQPALLFVQPDCFSVLDWPIELAPYAGRLDSLYDRLFAGEMDQPTPQVGQSA